MEFSILLILFTHTSRILECTKGLCRCDLPFILARCLSYARAKYNGLPQANFRVIPVTTLGKQGEKNITRLAFRTDHWLLVGRGALRFAKMHGFKEEDLLTDEARRNWLHWKETLSDRDYYFPPRHPDKPEGGGTINVLALDGNGDIAGVTSTVGHHFKIVGRVGDSPIIGAGLFVDGAVGAACATGHGELAIRVAAAGTMVELIRSGATPQEACTAVIIRIRDSLAPSPEKQLGVLALRLDGEIGAASLVPGFTYARTTPDGEQMIEAPAV